MQWNPLSYLVQAMTYTDKPSVFSLLCIITLVGHFGVTILRNIHPSNIISVNAEYLLPTEAQLNPF
jgi:hypothetical protein